MQAGLDAQTFLADLLGAGKLLARGVLCALVGRPRRAPRRRCGPARCGSRPGGGRPVPRRSPSTWTSARPRRRRLVDAARRRSQGRTSTWRSACRRRTGRWLVPPPVNPLPLSELSGAGVSRLGRDRLEHPLRDVEVRVDVLHVVVLLERVDQAQDLLRGRSRRRPRPSSSGPSSARRTRPRSRPPRPPRAPRTRLSGVARDLEASSRRGRRRRRRPRRPRASARPRPRRRPSTSTRPAPLEQPRDRARAAEVAVVLRERCGGRRRRCGCGCRSAPRRSRRRRSGRSPRRRSSRTSAASASAPAPRAIARSMLSFGIEYERAFSIAFCEREVGRRVAAALLRRDDDRARELREELAALGVGGALLVLDRRPLAMPGHCVSSRTSFQEPLVHARVVGQLRVERRDQDAALARRAPAGRRARRAPRPGAGLLDPRRADEDAAQRLVVALELEVGLEARDLAPVRVAATTMSTSPSRADRSRRPRPASRIIPAHVPRIGAVETRAAPRRARRAR